MFSDDRPATASDPTPVVETNESRQALVEAKIDALYQRAEQLRTMAEATPGGDIVRDAMLRRAQELELQAWAVGLRFGPRLLAAA